MSDPAGRRPDDVEPVPSQRIARPGRVIGPGRRSVTAGAPRMKRSSSLGRLGDPPLGDRLAAPRWPSPAPGPAAQRPADHDRRPGLRRPRVPRQPPDPDAPARRPGPGVGPVPVVLRLAGLLADPGQPDDRPVQLPDRRGRHLPGAVDDAPRRGHDRRDARPGAATGPGSSASGTWATTPRSGRSTRGSRRPWSSGAAGSARPPTRPGSGYFDPILMHNGRLEQVPGLLQRRLRRRRDPVHRGRPARGRSSPTSPSTPPTSRSRSPRPT